MSTADLRTLQLTVEDSGGVLRRVQLDDEQRQTLIALLRLVPLTVTTARLNRTPTKQVVAKPGIPLDLVAPVVDAFLAEIEGGESGPNARPMHPAWARSLRDQCQAAGVAFHFKQHGEFGLWPDGLEFDLDTPVHQFPVTHHTGEHWSVRYEPVYRLGKRTAGRLLDGRTWDELPE